MIDTMQLKVCNQCGQEKDRSLFYGNSLGRDGLDARCRACRMLYSAQRRRNMTPDQIVAEQVTKYRSQVKRLYGLSWDQYKDIVVQQDGKCAICGGGPRNNKSFLSVDHCHTTGKVRGLLCDDCNNLLARADDDPDILLNALRYLGYEF